MSVFVVLDPTTYGPPKNMRSVIHGRDGEKRIIEYEHIETRIVKIKRAGYRLLKPESIYKIVRIE